MQDNERNAKTIFSFELKCRNIGANFLSCCVVSSKGFCVWYLMFLRLRWGLQDFEF